MQDELAVVLVRWAWLGFPVLGLALVLGARPPERRVGAAALVATAWCLPVLLAVNAAAPALGWWRFHAAGGLLLGTPIEALVGWSLWWGALPALLLHRAPLLIVIAVAAWIDLLTMPQCAPVLVLGPHWITGEVVALVTALLPALLLSRWTCEGRQLAARSTLQALAFGGITFFVLPAGILAWEGYEPIRRAGEIGASLAPGLVVLALPALVMALSAVAEFAERGGGTPLPLDPPERLVVTGPYAFVRNPMQLGAASLLFVTALAASSVWLAAAAGVAVAYGVGLASWDETRDLGERFARPYALYRAAVRNWWPRWRPYRKRTARLYFAAGCGACEDVARFVRWLQPTALELLPAQQYERPLLRLTYRDGDWEEQGVAALGRALEHTCLPLAVLGLALRLPFLRVFLQLVVDASGGHARPAPELDQVEDTGLSGSSIP